MNKRRSLANINSLLCLITGLVFVLCSGQEASSSPAGVIASSLVDSSLQPEGAFNGGPQVCDDIFPVDTVSVVYSGDPTPYCVPVPFSSLDNYDVTFQGSLITDPYTCFRSQIVAYSYSFLPGGGFDGPYLLDSWIIDGVSYNGAFDDPADLVNLMNDINGAGFWQINAPGSLVFGGDPDMTYGNMEITHVASGNTTILMTNLSFQAEGFTVELTSPDIHLLITTDPDTGCADTLFINSGYHTTETDTLFITTAVNEQAGPFCLTGDELPGGMIENLGYCALPANGIAPLVNDSCLVYQPATGYVGPDEFCIIVCDDNFPVVCDTTLFIVNVIPAIDTVFLTIPAGSSSIDSCLDGTVLELPGPVDQAELCGLNAGELQVILTSNCLKLEPVNNFSGTTEACVVQCSQGICDTTFLVVEVEPPVVCEELFNADTLNVLSAVPTGYYCIPVPLSEILAFEVLLDGQDMVNFSPCDFGNVIFYNYASLPTGGFTLNSWMVNGVTLSGMFSGIPELTAAMNNWDPAGNWVNDVNAQTIRGGNQGTVYSNMVLTLANGDPELLQANVSILPLGSNLEIDGYGYHTLSVTAPDGCSDTLSIELEPFNVVTETLNYQTLINTSVNPICVNTAELLGDLQSFNFCSLPSNGSVSIEGDTCISYLPGLNFSGADEFCLVVCDDYQPVICDTFFIAIEVGLPVDTVTVVADNVTPFDTCLDGSILQLPGAIDTAFVCGSDPSAVALSFAGNCVEIDLDDSFVGSTIACVVHCTGDDPPICDTTILDISFNGVFPCDDFFDPDQATVVLQNDTGTVCLPVAPVDIGDYEILLDGSTYTGQVTGCDIDSVYTYFYGLVFGQGSLGPYFIEWSANGSVFTDTVADVAEAVNLMNAWDPAGNWMLEPTIFTIFSSNETGSYGSLIFEHSQGSVANLAPNFNGIPQGTLVYFTGEGQHEIVLTATATGCDDTLFINSVDPANVLQLTVYEGLQSDTTCLDTTGLPGIFSGIADCGLPMNGTISVFGNCLVYTPFPGYTGPDEACLQVCDDMGNCQTTLIQIVVLPFCDQYDLFPETVQTIEVDNCNDLATYCVPLEFDSLGNFGVLDNGFPYGGGFSPCNGSLTQISLDTGLHEIIFAELNTGCRDTLLADITCTVDSTGCGIAPISGDIIYTDDCDATAEFCLALPVADLPNFVVMLNGSPFTGDIGACSQNAFFTGVELDTGFHELVLEDTVKGCADTFLMEVSCLVLTDAVTDVIIPVGESTVLCLEDFDFPVAEIDSVVNVCADQSTGNASFQLDESTWCLTVEGILVGGDTACLKIFVEDTCAVFTVNVTVTEPCPDLFPGDYIAGGSSCDADSAMICLPLNAADLQNLAIELDGQAYDLPLPACADGFSIQLPTGLSDLVFTDTLTGCSESVVAEIVCLSSEVIVDDIPLGNSDTFCLDLAELVGNADTVVNLCESLSGENVAFAIDGNCIFYTGLNPGTDTACMIICDDLNVCDTTYFFITTVLNADDSLLVAVDDVVITGEGQPVVIDVLFNDTTNNLLDFFILDPPLHGQAVFLPNGSVNYVPDADYCDDSSADTFTYVICNPVACDTASVSVTVTCENLVIFNGFSPNGDNTNETFRILGLQNWPDHHLYIYNRWGNLVYESVDYQNDWEGTWDGHDLPDGTYFYVLDLGDGAKPEKGYLQIRR